MNNIKLVRRIRNINKLIELVISNMFVCEYENAESFIESVIDDIRWVRIQPEYGVFEINSSDLIEYIRENKYEYLLNYYNEHCMLGIQENIKRIVKEEQSKLQKSIIKKINEYGYEETADMMGITITKVIKISGLPIDSHLALIILYENINNGNLPTTYKQFTIESSSFGNELVSWEAYVRTGHYDSDKIERISVYATPFYQGEPFIPVEIDYFSLEDEEHNIIVNLYSDGDYFKSIKTKTTFNTVDELFEWYKEFYLPKVYYVVMEILLPEVHNYIDEKIKQDDLL